MGDTWCTGCQKFRVTASSELCGDCLAKKERDDQLLVTFAAAALTGIVAGAAASVRYSSSKTLAEEAWTIARAMMKERPK